MSDERLPPTCAAYQRREQRLLKALRTCAANDRSGLYQPEELRPSDGLTTIQAGVMDATWKTPREITTAFLQLLETDPTLHLPASQNNPSAQD